MSLKKLYIAFLRTLLLNELENIGGQGVPGKKGQRKKINQCRKQNRENKNKEKNITEDLHKFNF